MTESWYMERLFDQLIGIIQVEHILEFFFKKRKRKKETSDQYIFRLLFP